MSLLVKFKSAKILKLVTQVLHDSVDSFLMVFNQQGMSFQCIDGANVALSLFSVPKCDFTEYKVDTRITLGLKMGHLFKVFKRVHTDDQVVMSVKEHDDMLTIKTGTTTMTDTTKLFLVDLDVQHLDCDPNFSHYVTMSSSVFRGVCEKMNMFGETVTITVTADDITFSTKGEMGQTSAIFNTLIDEGNRVPISIETKATEPIKCTFGSKYLKDFSDSYLVSDKVVVCLAIDFPIGLLYKFYTKSKLCHHISPKIDDE